MDYWQSLLLGIIQGLTEFLPVSSSTHLALARKLMKMEAVHTAVYFDLLCHLGTLLAALTLLWKDLWKTLTDLKAFKFLLCALLPLIPAYVVLKPIRLLFAHQAGPFLICTAFILFYASRKALPPVQLSATPRYRDALLIGLAQSMALLPGISRSGSTLAAARLLGWEWQAAARFSFLLAIPTIFGGSILETLKLPNGASIPWDLCLIGFSASFAVGLGSLRLLFWILDRGTLRPFAWYCLAVGALSLLLML